MIDRLDPPPLPDWLEDQLPFDRYRVQVEEDLRMHVMEQGEGRPVLLFHGNPTWGYLYRRVAEQLASEPFRLIMPDLIGLGLSDRPLSVADHTLANHGSWMAALITKLDLSDAVVVVQDWGGPIGGLAMRANPGQMRGLVVLNTMLGAPKPGFTPTPFHRFFGSRAGQAIPWYRFLGAAQGDRRSISGLVQKSYSFPLSHSQGGSGAASALVRMVPGSLEHPSVLPLKDVEDFIECYDGPSAIVWGEKDPVLGKVLRRIKRQLPEADVTVTDAGHFIQEEEPAAIADAIRRVAAV